MSVDKIHHNFAQDKPSNLFRTVSAPATTKPQPVEIPGVLNQTRNLFKPYTGQDIKDNK
jgi:hypothetical protein